MSVGGPVSGIRFTGLSSGIDVESIVTQLMQIEAIPVSRLQAQKSQISAKQSIYAQFKTKLLTLNTASTALNSASAYSTIQAKSSDESIAKVSAADGATAGTYSLTVDWLAQNHKVSTAAQANATDVLGMTGTIMVSGKAVTVEATDTLTTLASKINGLGNGVAASILNGGTGQTYLSLTSSASGAKSKIHVSDLSGNVAGSLGMVTGPAVLREQVDADTVRSLGFKDSTTKLSSLTGLTSTGSFVIGGQTVNIDFQTDSLQDVANKINAASGGATASVVTDTVNGKTVSKLDISGGSVPAGITDTSGLLEAIGVYGRAFGRELVEAKNAQIKVDGVTVSSESNSVTGVIPGATVSLVKAGTVTLDFTRNDTAIKDKVKAFKDAFNEVIDYIRLNSSFDDETFRSGPLFGDQTASQVESTLSDSLFNNVGSGTLQNLSQIGFSFNSDGKLDLDEGKLDTIIASDASGLMNLLAATGTATGTGLKFVSATNKTLAGTYDVNITQAATKSSWLAFAAQTGPSTASETLSFNGTLFGTSTIDLVVPAGTTQAQLVTLINNDSRLKELVSASVGPGGALQVDSKKYGALSSFTVNSNLAAAADNSGIGNRESAFTLGLDVAGTINGETATGNGQFLTGNAGNSHTDGLQIQYTGTATGTIGSTGYSRGVTSMASFKLESLTDAVNGLLTSVDQSMTTQIEDLDSRIADIQKNLELRESTLRLKFAAMESAISRMNSQGSQLAAILG